MSFTPFVETDNPTMEAFNEKFQEAIQEAHSMGLSFESGSYVGTGTNAASISFSGTPLLVIITCNSTGYYGAGLVSRDNAVHSVPLQNAADDAKVSFSAVTEYGNTVSFESSGNPLNIRTLTYNYVAILEGGDT